MGFGGNVVPALLLAGHPLYQITAVENRRVIAERVPTTGWVQSCRCGRAPD
jgi:hypothetical protein